MRLIDADSLKKVIEQYQIQWNKNCETDIAHWDSCECILAILDNAPTIVVTTKLQFKERNNENGKLQRRKG